VSRATPPYSTPDGRDSSNTVAAIREMLANDPLPPQPDQLRERAIGLAAQLAPLAPADELRALATAAVAELNGLGPLQPLLADPRITEIVINNGGDVWVERDGRMERSGRLSADVTPRLVERILGPLGRRVDRLSPIVDARLADGSRLCAVIAPIAVDGPCLALRRFSATRRRLTDFTTRPVAELLRDIVVSRCNVLVSGATSSGKTSLLNALASEIRQGERIITLEDIAELRLDADHVLRLETRPANADGTGAISMAELVRTSLRLRPDRIVVGEVRGGEVVDMLQALNTGHDGSLSTCHANSARDALRRMESLLVQHTAGWPIEAVRDEVGRSLDVVVHVERRADGGRAVAEVVEVADCGAWPTQRERTLASRGDVVGTLLRRRM